MRILLIILALTFCSAIEARTGELFRSTKTVVCGNLGEIMEKITGADWREEPIWRGGPNEYQNMTTLFFNSETGSWTLIEYRNQTGCILGNGMSSQLTDRINIIK
jgi:hypothetical protein